MSRHSDETGFTLIELLIAATLMLIVLGATLGSFNNFTSNASRNFKFNDEQDQVRVTLDQIVKQIRNLANPTTGAITANSTTIAYAGDHRLVFQTSDPQKQWVSYCVDSSNAPASATRERIWYQTTTQSALTPQFVSTNMSGGATDQCKSNDSDWQKSVVVGDFVTNSASGNRPMFTYYQDAGNTAMSTPVALANTSKIVRVEVSIFMKLDPTRPPAETELESSAWMRNQNEPPSSAFTTKLSGSTYTFDGGDSSDPEQRTLQYDWYTAPSATTSSVPAAASLPSCSAVTPDFSLNPTWSCFGTTVVIPNQTVASNTYVFLRVTDPGGLQSMSQLPVGGCLSATSTSRQEIDCGKIP